MNTPQQQSSIFGLLGLYKGRIILLAFLTITANVVGLFLPKIVSKGIDTYMIGTFNVSQVTIEFSVIAIIVFVFTYLQSIMQTLVSEKVAYDLRKELSEKISRQDFATIEKMNPSKLLTNLTSDIDSVKLFIAQAIPSLISSIVVIIGVSILLLSMNWKLGLVIMLTIPLIGVAFFIVFAKVKILFMESRKVIDRLNQVIRESVIGAALVRILNSRTTEEDKFDDANTDAKNLGLKILSLFAAMIPIITFIANMSTLFILLIGGRYVISGSMTIGGFAAFMSYVAILIFPVIVIGFIGNIISQASVSYTRIQEILAVTDPEPTGTVETPINGAITVDNVSLVYGEKHILKDISFVIKGGTKTAILGPTGAGKTQLMHLLSGLIEPTEGKIKYNGALIKEYKASHFHKHVAMVFQDSVIFNVSLRENIAFSGAVSDKALERAIKAAELETFIRELPDGLDTIISERGTSLSGGQKQRVMLARALVLEPKVLLLDDFTARVDIDTEKRIISNIETAYPEMTLVSITQKIESVESYDSILVIMEGELLAKGTHTELLQSSPEYAQIYASQRSMSMYELRA